MSPTLAVAPERGSVSGPIRLKTSLRQGKGPDVGLIADGTKPNATYETVDGFPAIYDGFLELYCYARLVGGALESTGMPISSPPPPDVERHAKELAESRAANLSRSQSQLTRFE